MNRRIFTGDRRWNCQDIIERVLVSMQDRQEGPFTVIHGDCETGVDHACRVVCERMGVPHEPHPAEWDRFGKGAGPLRNQTMVDLGAEYAVAIHRQIRRSKGTQDCAWRCLAAGIPVYLIDGKNPTRRLTEEDLR